MKAPQLPQLRLVKHTSPDNPKGARVYYVIESADLDRRLYNTPDYDEAVKRFKHIQSIGYTAYIEEIKIRKEIMISEDFNCPELVKAIEEAAARIQPDAVIGDNGEVTKK